MPQPIESQTRWPIARIAGLLLLAGALGVAASWAVLWGVFADNGVIETEFDSDKWKQATEIDGYRTVRSQMVEDLLSRYDFRGWPLAKVEKLLGPPDERNRDGWQVAYYLGIERQGPWSLDNEWLVFRLDESDAVTEARTVVD